MCYLATGNFDILFSSIDISQPIQVSQVDDQTTGALALAWRFGTLAAGRRSRGCGLGDGR